MKKSPIFPKSEIGDYNGHDGFDSQLNFSKFLEETKNHASQIKSQAPSPYQTKAVNKGLGEERKKKKSWKYSLFSWMKVKKKSKSAMESSSPCISNPRRGSVSGPIYGSGRKGLVARPISGPLSSLFTPVRKGEAEVPYMCLDQINYPIGQTYGPVYLVT
ncbi:hypothetical protein GIB67_009755 [Kingdonia uniflora]|uniref:Uncharacterized protein n=1 Tax=Kingdonia uniflora TaxID=39325 RepID=A0A7J7LBF9_9MAGN|nr:hypothetical protein GIB67_009755 [Kingdonia uniflora]